MKSPLPALILAILATASCDRASSPAEAGAADVPPKTAELAERDTPLLPVEPGDEWHYSVHVEVPAGVTSPTAAAADFTSERVRRYLGKVKAAEELPAVDCFEIRMPKTAPEREFVEIYDDRILLRGSLVIREDTTRPLWFDKPIPFLFAGMRAGSAFPEIGADDESRTRKIQVVGREQTTVPAGTYETIRLLMTGRDGDFELRRTIWFAPGTGIVREEKTRYGAEKLIFRETQELVRRVKSSEPKIRN